MNRRELLACGAGTLLTGAAAPVWAADAAVEGRQYRRLATPVAVSATGGKIEVLEFFMYSCPHCFAFDPTLEEWIKKLPADVSFKRVPVAFRPMLEPQQRLLLSIEVMGLMDQLHRKVFNAVHVERLRLGSPDDIVAWVGRQGVDAAKFTEVFNSFGVKNRAVQCNKLSEAYKIEGVPALGIHGRFLTAPSMMGGSEEEAFVRSLGVADQLIQKARKGG